MPNQRGSPPDTLVRRAAKRGVSLRDIARHTNRAVNHQAVAFAFQRERNGSLRSETRARYERAIDDAAKEREALAKLATEWLRGEIAAGRLEKNPSTDELRRVAAIVRSVVLDAGANGASKRNGR